MEKAGNKEMASLSDFAKLAQKFEIKENLCWEWKSKNLFSQLKLKEESTRTKKLKELIITKDLK